MKIGRLYITAAKSIALKKRTLLEFINLLKDKAKYQIAIEI